MGYLDATDETYFTTVRGMCRQCRQIVPARVFFRDGQVWQQSLCPDCPGEPALIAADQSWYLQHVLQTFPDRAPVAGAHPPVHGCPHDCGPCAWHATPCQLPVFSVTNACNLRCPICFTYNRNDRIWHMPVEELRVILDGIISTAGPVDLINITGGEPTLHPEITELLNVCHRPEIGRITMNTNGIRLAQDQTLCDRLAELRVNVVLSFNTLESRVSERLHGQDLMSTKLRAIENLTQAGVRITLLCVLIRGINEEMPGRMLDMMRSNDHLISLTIQTMTYTGQGGGQFHDRRHLPVDEAVRIVCEHANAELIPDDFAPRPSAHPLCYATTYLVKDGMHFIPFTRFASQERLQQLLEDSYLMRLATDDTGFCEVIDALYAQGNTEMLKIMRRFVERLYPRDRILTTFERQRLAEESVRTIYIHAHMDEDTFDCSRAMLCPDQVPVSPGRFIPACTYNLFYRMQDERFYATEAVP